MRKSEANAFVAAHHRHHGETWIICGGRDFEDREMFENVMSELTHHLGCPVGIVHGACRRGVDDMAAEWAKRMGIGCIAMPADWATYGSKAGPIRNAAMLKLDIQAVVAFPGGSGTADMVRRALKAREAGATFHVIEIHPKAGRRYERRTVGKEP